MEAIHKKRLQKLADHLKNGKLGHQRFDFSQLNSKAEPYSCGTAGCALGECPIVFPKLWRFNGVADPALKHEGSGDSFWDAEIFFGLTDEESSHLFNPESQHPLRFGGEHLHGDATRRQVARNIEAFIKVKERQK